jgi:hypothetical protein
VRVRDVAGPVTTSLVDDYDLDGDAALGVERAETPLQAIRRVEGGNDR